MYYKTCQGCAIDKEGCSRRKGIKDAVKGLDVTSINFKCRTRKPVFYRGQRVEVSWIINDGYEDFHIDFGATIISESSPGHFHIRVDDGPSRSDEGFSCPQDLSGNGHAKVSMHNLRPLDEPDAQVCSACDETEFSNDNCYGDPIFAVKGADTNCLKTLLAQYEEG